VADLLDLVLASPAVWGGAGAFIYAGPRWLACFWPTKGTAWRCTAEGAVCIIIGTLAAQAFAGWASRVFHQAPADLPAVAAMIGLLANPLAPRLVDGLSSVAANFVTARAAKILKGDDR
jgi:predicted anti-sigma-YlaC factor YlaD